jgi:hypothetical protein
MGKANQLAGLAAAWPDWEIFLSRHGQYWCARYRHRIPSGVLLSGREHPHATVIADGPQDLAIELAKQPTLNEWSARQ